MWGTKRGVLASKQGIVRVEAPRCMNFAQMAKMLKFAKFEEKLFFEKLFYTTLVEYKKKHIVPLSSENML